MRQAAAIGVVALLACTDAGVVGELAPSRSPSESPTSQPSAAGTAPTPPACASGGCEQEPQLCASGDLFCLFCDDDSDCHEADEPYCGRLSTCTQCRSASDCPTSAPTCDDGDCVDCTADDECLDSQRCNDGRCEPD